MSKLTCFKAYDIRGRLGDELNADIVYRIGRAFGQFLKTKTIVVGGDVRLSSKELKSAVTNGLLDSGVNVIDLGEVGTEEVYFATSFLNTDGGIEVTASHNPMDYNGMKLVRAGSRPQVLPIFNVWRKKITSHLLTSVVNINNNPSSVITLNVYYPTLTLTTLNR